ncbi:NTF2-like N-terminal transpeptidase domain-containing protein [Paenibacillus sp. SAF-054]|uniref:NTF2-like N-terminal transpeptidase domain-containing protein n=1 Tax=unclassified Paenibacillus TaxID=185978 RepID=UPI003F8219E3
MNRKQIVMYGLLSFLAASVLALYVYFFGQLEEQTPNDTVQSYILSLQTQNFEELYDLMTPESLDQSGLTREQFVKKYQSIFGDMGVTAIEVTAGTPIKGYETSDYTMDYSARIRTFIGEIQEKYKLRLTKVKNDKGHTWKIEWQPSLILPDMEHEDKVSRVSENSPEQSASCSGVYPVTKASAEAAP